jgi:hypothetical protein
MAKSTEPQNNQSSSRSRPVITFGTVILWFLSGLLSVLVGRESIQPKLNQIIKENHDLKIQILKCSGAIPESSDSPTYQDWGKDIRI